MLASRTKRVALVAAGLAAILIGLLIVLELPFLRAALVARALQQLEQQFNVRARIERVDVSLATLRFRLHDVRLAAPDQEDRPFLTVDEVHVDLPWSAVWADPAVEVAELIRPRVTLAHSDTGWNLPTTNNGEPSVGEPPPLPSFGRLAIVDLGVDVRGAAFAVAADAIDLELATAPGATTLAGPLRLAAPARVEWEGRQTSLDRLDATLALDRRDLVVEQLEATLPEGRVAVDGMVRSLIGDARLDLSYRAELALDRVAAWWEPDLDVDGQLALAGTMTGPVDALALDVDLASDAVRWAELSDMGIGADARVGPDGIRIESATVTHGASEVTLRGELAYGDASGISRVDARWRDVDTGQLLSAIPLTPPVVPAATTSGRLQMTWTALRPGDMELTLEVDGRADRGRDGELPLGGAARLEAHEDRWSLALDGMTVPGLAISGGLEGRFTDPAAAIGDASVAGDIRVEATDLGRLARAFAIAGLVTEPPGDGPTGRAQASVSVAGTLGDPRLEGTVGATQLGYRGVAPIGLEAHFIGDARRLTFDELGARHGASTITGTLALDFDAGTATGEVLTQVVDLSAFAPAVPPAVAPTGALQATAVVSGPLSAPRLDATVEAAALTLFGRPIERASARLRLDQDAIVVDELEAGQQGGTWAASGRYRFAARRYEARIAGRGLALETLATANRAASVATGRLDVDFDGAGTLVEPFGSGRVRIAALEWERRALGAGDLRFSLDGGSVRAEAALPALNLTAAGRFGVGDDRTFELSGRAAGAELRRLFPTTSRDLPMDVRGTITAGIRASGERTDLAAARLTIDVEQLDGQIGDTPVRLTSPGRLDYGGGTLTADRLELAIADARLTIAGRLGDRQPGEIAAQLAGDLGDLVPLARLAAARRAVGATLELGGAVNARATMSGSFGQPEIAARLELRDGSVRLGSVPPVSGLDVALAYDDATLRLERFAAAWQGATVSGQGRMAARVLGDRLPAWYRDTLDPAAAEARLSVMAASVSPEILTPFIDADWLAELDGEVAARLEIEAAGLSWEEIRGRLALSQLTLTVAGLPMTQQRPTELELVDGELRVTSWAWGSLGNELTLGGHIDLGAPDPVADLTITGNVDLRVLSVFSRDVATGGQAYAIVNVLGTAADPILTGTIELTDGEIRLAKPQLVVSDLNGVLFFERDRIRTHELAGSANGGPLELDGRLRLDGVPEGAVDLVGRAIAMELPDGLQSEVDADLRLAIEAGGASLGGTVTVQRGDYREPLALTTGLLAALQERQAVATVGAPARPALDALRLDVRVVTADDIVVDNNYASGAVGIDLRVVGTAGSPALTGRAALREGGEVRLGGNLYEIEAGAIDFVDPTGIQPQLNVTARTRVASYDVTLTVAGVPEELTTTLQSDPQLPESDIVSLLLTGRTLGQVGAAPGAIARDQALGLLSGELLGAAGRTVGVDTIRIERDIDAGAFRADASLVAGETNPGSRLTVGKNVGRDVQLIVSQNLRESGLLTWILEYLPWRNIELRGVVDDASDRSYEFRHAITLGAPPREVQAGAAPRRADQHVGAVRLAGEPGFDEGELLDRLDLTPGDQFDFHQWQADRDRLDALYWERGYLEARVRARRSQESDGTVALEYDIQRGPRTRLTIEGHELSGDTRRRMEDAWTRAVFDGFLLDELGALARRELVADGFVGATVEATVVEPRAANEKEIVVRIDGGERFGERQVVFRGNERLTDEQLDAELAAQDLRDAAWTDPRPLTESLTNVYRSQGFLEARVEVGEAELAGDRAVLPIVIAEGPPFRMSEVALEGVGGLSEDEVWAAAGLRPGEVYSDIGVQRARAALAARYRRAGFSTAHVVLRAVADRDTDTVAVTIAVDEGPRQVVDEIVIAGATRTRPSLISRALQIEPGQTVDLGAWNEARKRLYDTGAFRSVDIEPEPLAAPTTVAGVPVEPVRARVRLEEWPAYRLRYGLQVKDERTPVGDAARGLGLGVVGDLTHQNLLGRAATVGTSFRYDVDQQALRGFVTVPAFFGLPVTSNVFASRRRESLGEGAFAFTTDITRLTLEQRVTPRPDVTLAYSYNFERNLTSLADPDPQFPDEPPFRIVRLDASAVVDTRDDPFDATRGWFHSSTIEYAPSALGSHLRFAKYLAQHYHHRPVWRDVVIASAARLGLATAFGGDLIPSERFFAGGGSTVRGYAQDSLGPTGFFGGPTGGSALLVLNQEVRFPLVSVFRGVGFVDAGTVFPSVADLSLRDLQVGAGLGLRADTPFGLLRLDFGVPVSTVEGDRKGRFYFSLGQVF